MEAASNEEKFRRDSYEAWMGKGCRGWVWREMEDIEDRQCVCVRARIH